MKQSDYYIAYKFLKLRATKTGIQVMEPLDNLTNERKEKNFLRFSHLVKFI